jgi:hypothetical protein
MVQTTAIAGGTHQDVPISDFPISPAQPLTEQQIARLERLRKGHKAAGLQSYANSTRPSERKQLASNGSQETKVSIHLSARNVLITKETFARLSPYSSSPEHQLFN